MIGAVAAAIKTDAGTMEAARTAAREAAAAAATEIVTATTAAVADV